MRSKQSSRDLGIEFTREQFSEIMNHVKAFGDKGRKIMEEDLLAIVRDVIGAIPETETYIILDQLTVLTGSVTPTSTVKLRVRTNDEYDTLIASSIGVGPVDASLKAIMAAFAQTDKLDLPALTLAEYHIDAVTGGTDALARVNIKIRDVHSQEYEGQAVHEDIVMSSSWPFLNGFNKLMIHKYKNHVIAKNE